MLEGLLRRPRGPSEAIPWREVARVVARCVDRSGQGMAGGDTKSPLPASSQLGLSTVSDNVGPASVPADAEPLYSLVFDAGGKHIRLNLFEVSSA